MNHHDYTAVLAGNGKAAIYIRQATAKQTTMGSDRRELHTQHLLVTFAYEYGLKDENLVIFNDTGLPATSPPELRGGLRALIRAIEASEIKAVFMSSEYSLYRDGKRADILFFVRLCQQHHVFVFTPDMVYDFTNPVHVKLFQFRLETNSFVLYARMVQSRTRRNRTQKRGK